MSRRILLFQNNANIINKEPYIFIYPFIWLNIQLTRILSDYFHSISHKDINPKLEYRKKLIYNFGILLTW